MFFGPARGGHWTLLFVDKRNSNETCLSFFDSMPNYEKQAFPLIQKRLESSELVGQNKKTKWKRVLVPLQGPNDCAIWLMMAATKIVQDCVANKKTGIPQQYLF